MKKEWTIRIGIFIATAIIFAAIGVNAQIALSSNQVSYSNTTVEGALNNLYTKANIINGFQHVGTTYGGKANSSSNATATISRSVSSAGTYIVYVSIVTNDGSLVANQSRGSISGCSSKTDTMPSYTNKYDDSNIGGYANLSTIFSICKMNGAGTIKYTTLNNINDSGVVMTVFKL